MIVANDATVKGGTYYPMTVKKHLRAQEIALQNRLPCIYLVDSGGAILPNQDEVFPDREHFGRIFYNQANMSAQGIPQIAVVMGSCTAGGAYVPAMSDETDHRQEPGHDLPRRPAAGEGRDRRGGHRRGPGRRRRAHAPVRRGRPPRRERRARAGASRARIVASLNRAKPQTVTLRAQRRAAVRPAGALRRHPGRHAQALRRARGHRAHRRRLASSTSSRRATAPRWSPASRDIARHAGRHRRQQRHPVLARSRMKGAHFIELCCQRGVPLRVPAEHHRLHGRPQVRERRHRQGRRQDGHRGGHARRCRSSPCIIGGSFGAGNYGMCGRAYSPRFLWMWPNARITVMGGEQAASVLATVQARRHRGQGRQLVGRGGGGVQAADPRAVRAPGPPVLRHRAAVGRRRHRPGARRAACWRWRWRRR